MEKLPEDFKHKWVAALRSGKYQQGEGYLLRHFDEHSLSEYCCLGVACIVAGIDEAKIKHMDTIARTNVFKDLPKILKGSAEDNSLVKELVYMNDIQGNTFAEIADYIEENL